jgi:hypothetical protein
VIVSQIVMESLQDTNSPTIIVSSFASAPVRLTPMRMSDHLLLSNDRTRKVVLKTCKTIASNAVQESSEIVEPVLGIAETRTVGLQFVFLA